MTVRIAIRRVMLFWAVCQLLAPTPVQSQSRPAPVRTAYSAFSAGIGTLWLTQDDGYFKKHNLDSNLIYIRGGTTAVQALLAGEIQFGHLSPAPMMTAWAQRADFVWIGTTTHQMVFTPIADSAITKGSELRGKKIGITEYDKAISSPPYSGLKGLEAVRDSLLDSTPQLKNVDLRKFVDDRFVNPGFDLERLNRRRTHENRNRT